MVCVQILDVKDVYAKDGLPDCPLLLDHFKYFVLLLLQVCSLHMKIISVADRLSVANSIMFVPSRGFVCSVGAKVD